MKINIFISLYIHENTHILGDFDKILKSLIFTSNIYIYYIYDMHGIFKKCQE